MKDTMSASEHLKLFGLQYANEFIHTAENNISVIIAIENHVHRKIPNDTLKGFSNNDLSTIDMSKRYLACHCIGMAFEILYKTAILMENKDFTHTHKISTLHAQLETSKEEIEKIIIDHGWETVENFTSYLDDYFTNPNNKYFESYLTFGDEKHKHPKRLINLFRKISEFVVKNANENNVKKPTNWSYPIRLLSR